jgi:DhnA family fructose-bisphosphate aldolase class Ia
VTGPIAPDGRTVVVAVDHPLYSWPCAGLEDRDRTIREVSGAGADALIASYGTVRDFRAAFGAATPILKLDLTTVTVGGTYPLTEYVCAYTVDDALRVGAGALLTFVQLGADFELEALRLAGRSRAAGSPIRPIPWRSRPRPAPPSSSVRAS